MGPSRPIQQTSHVRKPFLFFNNSVFVFIKRRNDPEKKTTNNRIIDLSSFCTEENSPRHCSIYGSPLRDWETRGGSQVMTVHVRRRLLFHPSRLPKIQHLWNSDISLRRSIQWVSNDRDLLTTVITNDEALMVSRTYWYHRVSRRDRPLVPGTPPVAVQKVWSSLNKVSDGVLTTFRVNRVNECLDTITRTSVQNYERP